MSAFDELREQTDVTDDALAKLQRERAKVKKLRAKLKASALPEPGSVEAVKLAVRLASGLDAAYTVSGWMLSEPGAFSALYARAGRLSDAVGQLLFWLDEKLPDGEP